MEKLKIDDFTRYNFLSGIKHSPDGRHGCYVVHQTDFDQNKYLSNLWILDLEKNNCYQLTSFDTERSFLWLDNETIAFPDIRDPKDKEKKDAGEEFTQFYRINLHGGEALKLFRINRNVKSIKMLNENTFLFTSSYNSNQKDLCLLCDEEKTKELKARKEEKDFEVLEEIPFWSNGGGFTNRKRSRLYSYNRISGEVTAVTEPFANVEQYNLNSSKTKAVIIHNTFKDKAELTDSIAVLDIAGNKLEEIKAFENMNCSYANFISDTQLIVRATDMKRYGMQEHGKFYIYDLNTKDIKCITPELDLAVTNSVGSDCRLGGATTNQVEGECIYFVTTEGHSSYLNRMDKTGAIEKLTDFEGSVDDISVKGEDILYIGMKHTKLQELYRIEGKAEKQMTRVNEWVYAEKQLSRPEHISFEVERGVLIDGWIIKPVGMEEGKKYPAILDIHGGPKTVYGTVYFHEMQYWANEGYAVFFCNPRGSDGKGNPFADIRGKYGTIDYEDIMKFTDEVLKCCSFIDADRIGVTGGSYGGFMTNWIIGHTHRFKAAATQRSISNWVSMHGTTDIGYYFAEDQIAATPWSNQEKLWEHSPLKYADRVKTPLLVIHSEEDYRCWLVEGLQMFTALKLHGVEARLCMFRGENHEMTRSGKPKSRLRSLKEITEWFNKHLKC